MPLCARPCTQLLRLLHNVPDHHDTCSSSLDAQEINQDVDVRRRRPATPVYMPPSTTSTMFKMQVIHLSQKFERHVARPVEFVQP